jgi:hypothetical protein
LSAARPTAPHRSPAARARSPSLTRTSRPVAPRASRLPRSSTRSSAAARPRLRGSCFLSGRLVHSGTTRAAPGSAVTVLGCRSHGGFSISSERTRRATGWIPKRSPRRTTQRMEHSRGREPACRFMLPLDVLSCDAARRRGRLSYWRSLERGSKGARKHGFVETRPQSARPEGARERGRERESKGEGPMIRRGREATGSAGQQEKSPAITVSIAPD